MRENYSYTNWIMFWDSLNGLWQPGYRIFRVFTSFSTEPLSLWLISGPKLVENVWSIWKDQHIPWHWWVGRVFCSVGKLITGAGIPPNQGRSGHWTDAILSFVPSYNCCPTNFLDYISSLQRPFWFPAGGLFLMVALTKWPVKGWPAALIPLKGFVSSLLLPDNTILKADQFSPLLTNFIKDISGSLVPKQI